MLIGSIHVREYAKKYNLRFVFLESGKGAVLRAIREAASTILVRCQDRDEFKLISNIVDYTFTGTAVFDKQGVLQKWNPAFASMFAGESGTDWKVRIPLIFSSSRLQKVLDGSVPGGGEILRTEERDYAVTWQPVWEGDQLVRAIAFGKCLLAFSDAVDLNYYMQHPLKKCAKNTITDSQALIEEIERVRHNGYAIDDEEGDDDLFCIGVPILADGTAIGAISISGPIQRMKNEDLPRKIQFMTDLRREISDKLSMK